MVLKLGMGSPKWVHSPQAQNGVPSHTMEVVWDEECWSQRPFLSLPGLDPVTGGDSGLATVTSCPHRVPLVCHCSPNIPWALGPDLGAQPHGRLSHRGQVWPRDRGHSPIVPVPSALVSRCAGAISTAESPPALSVHIPDVPQCRGCADRCPKIGECSGGCFSSPQHCLIPFLPVAHPWQAG